MPDKNTLKLVWQEAAGMDPSLKINKNHITLLNRKFVRPQTFSRDKMFQEMAKRHVSIFKNVPVLVKRKNGVKTRDVLVQTLSKKFPQNERSRVQVGPSQTITSLPVREIMRRWLGNRAIVGVTDLHIRGTKVEDVINTNILSNFNTLIQGSEDLALQEMMTLVISSRGNVTDSHSDDPDGTNHCFFGKKLWLAWDTFEGLDAGIEDVERQNIFGHCKFSMSKFLTLKSSRWFYVSSGETLFLPGNLTHKVLTLEPYLGVGSFHIGLPSCLDSLTRWIKYGPLWLLNDPKHAHADLLDEAAKVTLQIAKRAQLGSQRVKDIWGYDYLHSAYNTWKRSVNPEIKSQVLQHKTFQNIINIAANAK